MQGTGKANFDPSRPLAPTGMVSQAVAESGSRSLGTKPIGILLEAVKQPPHLGTG